MTGFGCVCDHCGTAFEAKEWQRPFWCARCILARYRAQLAKERRAA
jgi:hypothetical protein